MHTGTQGPGQWLRPSLHSEGTLEGRIAVAKMSLIDHKLIPDDAVLQLSKMGRIAIAKLDMLYQGKNLVVTYMPFTLLTSLSYGKPKQYGTANSAGAVSLFNTCLVVRHAIHAFVGNRGGLTSSRFVFLLCTMWHATYELLQKRLQSCKFPLL